MMIGKRLRTIRESRNMSQGEVESQTGLLRCYISRVENGHTVPSLETLEKFARALGVRMYELMYDGASPPSAPKQKATQASRNWESTPAGIRFLEKISRLMRQIDSSDRSLILHLAEKVVKRVPESRTTRQGTARSVAAGG